MCSTDICISVPVECRRVFHKLMSINIQLIVSKECFVVPRQMDELSAEFCVIVGIENAFFSHQSEFDPFVNIDLNKLKLCLTKHNPSLKIWKTCMYDKRYLLRAFVLFNINGTYCPKSNKSFITKQTTVFTRASTFKHSAHICKRSGQMSAYGIAYVPADYGVLRMLAVQIEWSNIISAFYVHGNQLISLQLYYVNHVCICFSVAHTHNEHTFANYYLDLIFQFFLSTVCVTHVSVAGFVWSCWSI